MPQKDSQHDYFSKLKETPGKLQANSIVAKLSAPSDERLTDKQLEIHNAFINFRNTATLVTLMQEGTLPINKEMLTLHETSLGILQQHLALEELDILIIAITKADIDNSQ